MPAKIFAGQVMEFVRYHAMKTSIELARTRGAFPAIKGSLYDPEKFALDAAATHRATCGARLGTPKP